MTTPDPTAVLRSVQWSAVARIDGTMARACPACRRHEREGHAVYCPIREALATDATAAPAPQREPVAGADPTAALQTDDCIDVTELLRSFVHVGYRFRCGDPYSVCPSCEREEDESHAPDCALAAAIADDPTAEIARLRAEVEQAHAALDKAAIGREHVETDGDFGEVIVERRTLTLAERVGHLDTDRRMAWDAHADAMAEVERLTRERDEARAENEQLRAAIVAWNDYNEATSQHTIAQRMHDEAESDERRRFWGAAILTHAAACAAAMKRLDAMGAWRGGPTWTCPTWKY